MLAYSTTVIFGEVMSLISYPRESVSSSHPVVVLRPGVFIDKIARVRNSRDREDDHVSHRRKNVIRVRVRAVNGVSGAASAVNPDKFIIEDKTEHVEKA